MQTVWSVATYEFEAWTIKAANNKRLNAFEKDMNRRIHDANQLDRTQVMFYYANVNCYYRYCNSISFRGYGGAYTVTIS